MNIYLTDDNYQELLNLVNNGEKMGQLHFVKTDLNTYEYISYDIYPDSLIENKNEELILNTTGMKHFFENLLLAKNNIHFAFKSRNEYNKIEALNKKDLIFLKKMQKYSDFVAKRLQNDNDILYVQALVSKEDLIFIYEDPENRKVQTANLFVSNSKIKNKINTKQMYIDIFGKEKQL